MFLSRSALTDVSGFASPLPELTARLLLDWVLVSLLRLCRRRGLGDPSRDPSRDDIIDRILCCICRVQRLLQMAREHMLRKRKMRNPSTKAIEIG